MFDSISVNPDRLLRSKLPEELDKKLFDRLSREVEEVSRYVPPLFREEYERGVQQGIQ